MFTVVKVGGCNGSGKTTLMRAVMDKLDIVPVHTPEKRRFYVSKRTGITHAVLGDYSPERACGGMDTISDKNIRYKLVEEWSAVNNRVVWFEGLMTGKTFGALGGLSDTPRHMGRWLYVFMDTPFDVCVERVLARRKARGNLTAFDPERTMRSTFRGCQGAARIAAEHGHKIVYVNHKLKPSVAAGLLVAQAEKHVHAR